SGSRILLPIHSATTVHFYEFFNLLSATKIMSIIACRYRVPVGIRHQERGRVNGSANRASESRFVMPPGTVPECLPLMSRNLRYLIDVHLKAPALLHSSTCRVNAFPIVSPRDAVWRTLAW